MFGMSRVCAAGREGKLQPLLGAADAGVEIPAPGAGISPPASSQESRKGAGGREFQHSTKSFPLEWEMFVRQERIPGWGLCEG